MTKKKIIVTIVALVLIAAVITGAVAAYLWQQDRKLVADVQPVENLVWYYWGNQFSSYGMLTNDFSQDVHLIEGQTISEIFVEEGQEVKAGDQLMSYDMTLSNLQLDIQKLEVENIGNKIILATKELETLKKTKPISENQQPPSDDYVGQSPIMTTPQGPIERTPLNTPDSDKDEAGHYYYISGTVELSDAAMGIGTSGDPYIFYCLPGSYVEGAFLNKLQAMDTEVWVRFQRFDPDNGLIDPDTFFEFSNRQLTGIVKIADDARLSTEDLSPMPEDNQDSQEPGFEEPDFEEPGFEEPGFEDPGFEDPGIQTPEVPQGYTAKELNAAILKKEKELKDLDLQKRKAELQLEQMQKVSETGVVTAAVDGVVKTVGDKDNPPADGSAFLTVAGSEGLYVSGSLSELMLDDVQIGQTVFANSWETGMSFEATITEISPYPGSSSNSWGEGNPNVSYYPYTAYIADSQGLKNGEYVELTMDASGGNSGGEGEEDGAFYLQKAYVRQENGKYYVLKAGEDGRLVKQYVETGRSIYGEAIEIKSGLNRSEQIAFPYGKTGKEGVRVKEASSGGVSMMGGVGLSFGIGMTW